MKVDINTKMITLLGTPLSQSFAARMQNAGYEAAGLNIPLSSKKVRKLRITYPLGLPCCVRSALASYPKHSPESNIFFLLKNRLLLLF